MIKTIAATCVLAGALVVAPPPAEGPGGDRASTQDVQSPLAAQGRRERPSGALREAARSRPRDLSPELVEQILGVAAEVDPELAQQLESLRQAKGQVAFRRSVRHARHLLGLARLKERDPELYSMKVEELQIDAEIHRTLDALREARRTDSDSVGRLERELHRLVEKQVGISIAVRGRALIALKKHVAAMQEKIQQQLQQQGDKFPQTVEKRYRKLLEELEADLDAPAEPDTG